MFALDSFVMDTPDACVVDLTPPVFLGIASLTAQNNGSLLAAWAAATDSNPPIEYLIYVQKATATGLFALAPAYIRTQLNALIFQDSLGALLQAGETYYVGVRAKDALGNLETNLITLSALSAGVLTNTLAEIANQIASAAEKITGGPVASLETNEVNATLSPDAELDAKIQCD